MIPRYTLPQMGKIWTDENKFRTWLEVEITVAEVQAELKIIPKDEVAQIRERANFDIDRILQIEKEVKHDVIAFLTNVGEFVGEASRFLHLGMTSSDLLDTANALLMKQAGEILIEDIEKFRSVLQKRALEHKWTVCIGRSHGIHAEPTTFGLKLALWYDEMNRNLRRLKSSVENISYGKLSGAVGTFAHMDPIVEKMVCERLGLQPAPVSTQIIQRDRYAEFLTAIALTGATIEKIATEIRHLQRTEVLEAEEYFSKGQKGSSAMPHKRNPITCEQMSGLARLLRTNALAAMENIALWHERDISHSSVERVILPDSTILLNYMLHKMTDLIANLLVYPKNMQRNLNRTNGLIFSQAVLLALVRKGLLREKAYQLVQDRAMECWRIGKPFKELLLEDPEITKILQPKEIEKIFDYQYHLRNVEKIFEKAGIG
ncbi:adenylosuccinate lyase [candidate division KSB1 bacterium 4484_87]|nr:MAG: adenylosuccinate lyase [candidate division KSB1 bacterium 4484_87]